MARFGPDSSAGFCRHPSHRESVITRAALVLALGLSAALLSACGSDGPDATAEGTSVGNVVATPAPSVQASRSAEASAAAAPGGPSAALKLVLDDVRLFAPTLEGLYRNREYPRTLAEVKATLPEAGLELSKGNSLGAYRYDEKAVEFTLCIENSSGAYATYDTAPMATGDQGENGGCPPL